ncbi:TIGR02221 family CRISPR-associated protein [Herpetosiphon llansteffanensis]|uniref:TIGR02221 family CRISPR-associated protein n=1 Tax=Herpetosiphon llansteffanensis TaxID=2094568 RepID=UPI000D7BC5B6|nr:TIGR02221 family CRISPR-associated protein [Herpetosiphon llansteffanensis]
MAKIKAISFLGINNYQYTNYTLNTQIATTHKFFGATLTEFFPEIDEIYIVMTKEARAKHWDSPEADNLQKTLAKQTIIATPIDIKSGQNEAELWEIFGKTIKRINSDDQIIFDITNAFRSQPVLVLIMAAFLKVVRNVEIKALVYGAFEAKESIILPNGEIKFPNDDPATKTPVFDLTPFLTLLDWTTATNTFLQTGRAEQLTKLAESFENQAVKDFAEQMQTLSQELLTTRPVGVIQAASGFEQALAKVDVAVQQDPAMQPYQQLLERIKAEYSSFAIVDEPVAALTDAYTAARHQQRAFLAVQLDMIKWYLEKGLPIQAMTLAREWLVSLAMYYQGCDGLFEHSQRDTIKSWISNARHSTNRSIQGKLKIYVAEIHEIWKNFIFDASSDGSLVINIPNLRNDIAHCGMDEPKAQTAKFIIEKSQVLYDKLKSILH